MSLLPAPEQILYELTTIASQWRMLAIAWHLYFAIIALALLCGVRPSKRIAGTLLALPLLSVSLLALLAAPLNPFNSAVFAVATIALLVISSRLPRESVKIAPGWAVLSGTGLFAFGWVYPHFLDSQSWLTYLYSAPTGLVPCPTLSIVIGIVLVLDGLGSIPFILVLVATGLFYGAFGAAYLGVTIDSILLLGAGLLLIIVQRYAGKVNTLDQS